MSQSELAFASKELLSVIAFGDALEQARARKRVRSALKTDPTPVVIAALRRVGCQDSGSCGAGEPDGLCFVCAAIASAEGKP